MSTLWVLVCFGIFSTCFGKANEGVVEEGYVMITGASPVATTDADFICATLDWWPPEKCDYGTCSWGRASLLNLDLNNPVFLNAVKAFSPLKIRLGGTLQDKLTYQTQGSQEPCLPFSKNSSAIFGFNQGCLTLARWDELNSFFSESEAVVIFGLNALYGKAIQPNRDATGPWDWTNAASFIRYTVENGYNIYGWELGNELSGTGIGVRIPVDPYATDTKVLHDMVQEIYKDIRNKPLIIAPGGFFDSDWFQKFLDKTVGSLNVITQHVYNLGPGKDEHLMDRILNPSVLDSGGGVFRNLHNIVKGSKSSVVAWVGEAGGAYNSGRDKVSNAFVFSFWYLDQLGQASANNAKTYCRQSLIGGNYGLLNTTTYAPNPDYYSALLWHKLMGARVLSTNFTGNNKLRAYAHCAKPSQGVTILLINIDGHTSFKTKPVFHTGGGLMRNMGDSPMYVSGDEREEYRLTPMDGNIQSQTVLLNGKPLTVGESGGIPDLEPVTVKAGEPITVPPHSIVFVHMPYSVIPACM